MNDATVTPAHEALHPSQPSRSVVSRQKGCHHSLDGHRVAAGL